MRWWRWHTLSIRSTKWWSKHSFISRYWLVMLIKYVKFIDWGYLLVIVFFFGHVLTRFFFQFRIINSWNHCFFSVSKGLLPTGDCGYLGYPKRLIKKYHVVGQFGFESSHWISAGSFFDSFLNNHSYLVISVISIDNSAYYCRKRLFWLLPMFIDLYDLEDSKYKVVVVIFTIIPVHFYICGLYINGSFRWWIVFLISTSS